MVKVMRSFVRGPLEPHIAGFAEELLRQGYTRTLGRAARVLHRASGSLDELAEGVGLDELSGPVIERYLAERRAAGYVEYRSVKALQPLLDYLAPLGVLPVPQEVAPGPVEELLGRYRDYLLGERGLTHGTARGYVDCVRPFVATRVRGDVLDLAGMTAADVTGFVLAACPGRAVGSAKLIVCALRSLLRWLHLTGLVPASLAAAVPSVAGWRLSGLPKGLEPGSAAPAAGRVAIGARRPVDVTTRSCCCWPGWGCGPGRSPASGWTTSTGAAASSRSWARATGPSGCRCRPMWARRSRRICDADDPRPPQGRSVFVRVHAPHRALTTGGVTMVVFDAAQRAGLGKMHAHRLRHTAATAMLRAGSPLPEIGQVLRHRSPLTTAIYAKVDRDALAVLARPWPVELYGGGS